ncbi:CDP-6-deoxy-delta-3,4-glucoseen reductase [Pseudoduganella plicata]|uniref:CDP-6-deoxy-delta-3,4-glucoseen reductase n=1 Tax=Pseudoduganella plicata TaxID=321984 RepID=A0A4P7BLL7_9BURK|nr:CDP-6-deoxy-delta-3,4-glucoseen reductase [Pseudoduganella plicata]QBQ38625.1 CDP-6-deoxy-delta-3,4-glucoseen reductase [Pseudoduganella plicata]GGY83691.1 CDP-6-deoxy-delta-3,4-glucoseen reductase [Pseudoduganella plicata]
MTFQITVQPSGHQFPCDEDETVLAAAMRAGVGLPYGCKNGACSSCKGKVVSGSITHKPHQRRALTEDEEEKGMSLFCCALPHSDLVIEAREVAGSGDFPVKKMPSRVSTLERVAPDVIVITLQLPANEVLEYRAGQYIEFLLPGGKRRSYSMATAPGQGAISLHIRHMPGGLFTDQVFGTMKERDILRFEGPLGTFFVREDSDKPMVLLASGTGFAPIKAIVEQMRATGSKRPMVLYWGGRRPQDLYMDALCRQWEQELPNLRYVPVVSDALPEDGWAGRTGYVHQAVVADQPDLSGWQVYACGAPIVVESAKRDFTALCGLPDDEFYADAFTTEADLAKP